MMKRIELLAYREEQIFADITQDDFGTYEVAILGEYPNKHVCEKGIDLNETLEKAMVRFSEKNNCTLKSLS